LVGLSLTSLVVIPFAAFLVALLTLFSGFGLGTLLLPAVAVFFPVVVAVALTAVVHLANNLLKLALLGRQADLAVLLRFGIPANLGALIGAELLVGISHVRPLSSYTLGGREFVIEPAKLLIAVLILGFVALDLMPRFQRLTFDRKYLVLGGLLSGLFGGLSGHQGAFRSAFLLKAGLTKEQFIATGAVLASIVDVSRLLVYATMSGPVVRENLTVLIMATAGAFAGTVLGTRWIGKVTMKAIQRLVAVLLVLIAIGLGAGLI